MKKSVRSALAAPADTPEDAAMPDDRRTAARGARIDAELAEAIARLEAEG